MKKTVRLLAILMAVCMLFSSCARDAAELTDAVAGNASNDKIVDADAGIPALNGGAVAEGLSASVQNGAIPEKGTYNEGVVLVKYDGEFTENVLAQLDFKSTEPLYKDSDWYTVVLGDSMDTVEAVKYLNELGCFENVDYDYIMGVTADTASAEVSGNPDYAAQKHHSTHKIPEGWKHIKDNDKHPGGSSDVIIAVIDTGVDYNHLDLRNNIWVNPAEIPDNGIDDDGNGYIDDIYGWNCVGDNNDPMDDNGHGTHVAGIIAAENNKIGGVGVAYNCKIMVLKAGNSSGYFNNSDIAEAIQYAYMNGASVINMSFGGSNISIAVEEALENAYNTCVLVAAAGNEGKCNSGCLEHPSNLGTYPAALPYVIGVMSTNHDGSAVSSFSNYDHNPYNSIEYEVYAVGEAVPSCWPGNKYATLNGTSMAAPTVAGIAALLRSAYPDRETYSTKYLQSQIVNTGTINPYNAILKSIDIYHSVANVYEALTQIPKPEVNLYDYTIDDSVSISANNNGNGVIDAGETVRLYISLHNRGGVATNVNVSIDTMRNNDPSLTDPYFTFVNNTILLSDIGTYSVRESGDEKYFEIVVDSDCPNSYLATFNLHFTYENGLDEKDNTVYEGEGSILCNVNRGYHLSGVISEDTVFEADRLYIVSSDVVIPEGVKVTFEEGCEIQFYDDREYYNSPVITVYGTLNFEGTLENMIKITPDEHHSEFICTIYNLGTVDIAYTNAVNLEVRLSESADPSNTAISNSYLRANVDYFGQVRVYNGGGVRNTPIYLFVNSIENSYIDFTCVESLLRINTIKECFVSLNSCGFCQIEAHSGANNNIFYSRAAIPYGLRAEYIFGFYDVTCNVENNVFYSEDDDQPLSLAAISKYYTDYEVIYSNNTFSKGYQKYASQVIDSYYDASGNPTVDVYGSCSDITTLWPHVVSVEMFDKDNNPITTVGKEEIKVRVTFNRPMDKDAGTFLTFGTIEPYGDYRIDGEWISNTVWEGTYTLKAQIENGQNFLKVNNAWAAEDPTKTVFGEYDLHEFTVDTTAAMAMNLQAAAKENGIELTFTQDDYDTLLGYNIYRSEDKDGNFVKLNPAILLPTESTFLDENAEPGKTYWYTYTVVLTDFTESNPAGKVQATAMDTLAPNMYHTPVNQGYENNNLVISCTASDNVAISTVTLYYRAVGATEWKTLNMSKQSDKYSATVFGSEVTLAGLEYYIVASDGINTINKGSAETPYTVIVKDASSISRIGDVDGDGAITTKDALMLMQCLNEDIILSDDEFKRADLNGDGVLSAVEALRILQYINGNVTTLEM